MSSVRAKFTVEKIDSTLQIRFPYRLDDGKTDFHRPVPREMRTVHLSPVCDGQSDENKRFWDATPAGSIELGMINPEAWGGFELGKSYYIDFTRAPD